MAARSKVRFLATDIWDTPDDGKRYEVIDGQLCVSPPPVTEHQDAVLELAWRIRAYLEEHPLGSCCGSGGWPSWTVLMPSMPLWKD